MNTRFLTATLAFIIVTAIDASSVYAARSTPRTLVKFPQNVYLRDYTPWGLGATVAADYDETNLVVSNGYPNGPQRTEITTHYTYRKVLVNGWAILYSYGKPCNKLDTKDNGLDLIWTGQCNMQDDKITQAYVYINQYSVQSHPEYIANPTWFMNWLFRHETFHAFGFDHNVSTLLHPINGQCSPRSVVNKSATCTTAERSDVLTGDDVSWINQHYN